MPGPVAAPSAAMEACGRAPGPAETVAALLITTATKEELVCLYAHPHPSR